jgi:CheY-like chemotaxis protein
VDTKWHVLVVEDTEDDIQVISQLLTRHGIEVHVSRSGGECLKMLEDVEPNLVIMDLAMPEMDGWSTLVAMRSNPATAHIPVVAITAYNSPEVAQKAMEDGFDAYFPKPVHPVRFVQELLCIAD